MKCLFYDWQVGDYELRWTDHVACAEPGLPWTELKATWIAVYTTEKKTHVNMLQLNAAILYTYFEVTRFAE